ncbi:MAG: serine/threonine-protein kinase, partial [Acidobacteriota bacterium]|nr:serine/threonine-protein kinase [Acidobacteriota bacterium]
MAIEPGQRLLHYRLGRKIGEGGMGVVYEATDTRLHRKVALKVLPPELTQDPERRKRFHQEAQLAAAFHHPNIATVHDVGEQDGVTFIVMELVRGRSLRDVVRDDPPGVEPVLEIALGVAAGLARAHREGVLHRDLKPDNVLLTDEGVPKILDFGLSKLIGDAPSPEESPPGDEPSATRTLPQITRTGQIVGTLAYMSPEQLQGRPLDARTDVFSFGVLLYEMVAGKRPFAGDSHLEMATAILRDDPAPLDELHRGVPPGLQAILTRSLAKDPDRRFPSGQELHDALFALKRGIDAPTVGIQSLVRRPGFVGVAVVVLAMLGAGLGWWLYRDSRVSWARNEAIPEIERLYNAGDRDGAMRLFYEASEIIPDDTYLVQAGKSMANPLSFESEPPGATVYVKGYNHPEREWFRLGE